MIRLNLLDEKDIPPDDIEEEKPKDKQPKGVNWMILGPSIVALIYGCFLGYYFMGVKGPLKKVKREILSCKKTLNELDPKVAEAEKLKGQLAEMRQVINEFKNYSGSKKNWARVLNILSDELPDEVILTKVVTEMRPYTKKIKTAKGLVPKKIPAHIIKVSLEVPEEHQGKVNQYMKKLKKNDWLKKRLIGFEGGNLDLRKRTHFVSDLLLYFNVNSLIEGEGGKDAA